MNIVVTERDKKLLRLVACLAIIVIFGMYLIRPAMENHETLQNEYDAAEQKQQEYQTQIAALATIDDIIAQNEAALNTAKAQTEYARSNYERMKEAAKSGAVSQIQVLQAESTAAEMEASVNKQL